MKRRITIALAGTALAATVATAVPIAAIGADIGPSSSQSPYLLPVR
jgi:hypothetical protein